MQVHDVLIGHGLWLRVLVVIKWQTEVAIRMMDSELVLLDQELKWLVTERLDGFNQHGRVEVEGARIILDFFFQIYLLGLEYETICAGDGKMTITDGDLKCVLKQPDI